MECEFAIRELVADADASGVCISTWDSRRLTALDAQTRDRMGDIINVMGRRSCKAQGLGACITDWTRMSNGPHRLYIATRRSAGGARGGRKGLTVLGFLKTGRKHLFLRVSDMSAALREVEPLCVLDFYVHESLQRQGIGSKLMNAFFRAEGASPESVAYDRPSSKLISFLRKHFGLQDYAHQSNNYVVFRKFWDYCERKHPLRQQQNHHQEDRGRQRQRGAGGGTWSTISQRPLSGAKKHSRSRRQYAPTGHEQYHHHYHQPEQQKQKQHAVQQPQQSPSMCSTNSTNRYGCAAHDAGGYETSPATKSFMEQHRHHHHHHHHSGIGIGSHPLYGRRAQRYDTVDAGGIASSSPRQQHHQYHTPRYGIEHQQQQQQQQRLETFSSENDEDSARKSARFGRRARENDYGLYNSGYASKQVKDGGSSVSPMAASPGGLPMPIALSTGANMMRGSGGLHGSGRERVVERVGVADALGFVKMNAPF